MSWSVIALALWVLILLGRGVIVSVIYLGSSLPPAGLWGNECMAKEVNE